jgi:hypothetical protein
MRKYHIQYMQWYAYVCSTDTTVCSLLSAMRKYHMQYMQWYAYVCSTCT